jgi:hypothetical protein
MPVGASRTRELLEQLLAPSADSRALAADSVTDWTRSFGKTEASIISRVLLWLALEETEATATEAQLHALAELTEWDLVPADVLHEAGQLSRADLRGSSIEYYDYLVSAEHIRNADGI